MQFVIIAKDGKDHAALQRRENARADHILNVDNSMKNMVVGVATLDEGGKMNGSVMIVDFPTRKDLDEWLKLEPYVQQGVWEDITVIPCRVGPSFTK
ncbi:MAG: YciI family protein [Alphaproteobacteria bacterium]|nr:YciI family protein [Alphaproteobacteria bacterium]